MVSKNPTCGYQIVIPDKYWHMNGYVKVKYYLYGRANIWINYILNYFDPRAVVPMCQGSCMVYGPKLYRKHEYCQISIPYWYWILGDPRYIYMNGIKRKNDTKPTLN